MKLYTGKGDFGETYDLSGKKYSKDSPVINLLGTLDELNSGLGLVKAMLSNDDAWQIMGKTACNFILKIQKTLMKLMSHISDNKNEKYFLNDSDVSIIEKEIDRLSENIPKQHELIIPGKNIIEAQIQITRAVARRAERLFFAVKNDKSPQSQFTALSSQAGVYLNRLSDYLFVLSQQETLINVNFINQITGL